jgi:hypothetical protein
MPDKRIPEAEAFCRSGPEGKGGDLKTTGTGSLQKNPVAKKYREDYFVPLFS